MSTLTSSLIVRLVDRVSGPARGVTNSLLGIQRVGANANRMTFGDRLTAGIRRNDAALARARGGLVDAAAGFYALRTAIAAPVREAMLFESAMADVRKVVDFPTPQAFNDFRDGLIALSKEVPISVNGLAAIAAAAGQAGIAGDDLNRFTETAAKVGVAFDISADQAGEAMAKLMTGLGMSIDEVTLLSDAMNHLSNSQASSAAEILEVVRRVGAQGKQFGFSATEVAAFGSAMIAAGAQSDVAATSFRNMGKALTAGGSATKRVRNGLQAIGLDAEDVARRMQEDAVGTTVDVLERISQMPAEMQAALSTDIFGSEARALGPLLTNLDLVRSSLGLVEDASAYAGSSFKEFEVRAGTFENAVQIFNNRLSAMKVVIGAALIPAINNLMDAISPVIERVTQFAQAHPEVVSNVMAAVGSIVAFKVAIAGLKFIGLLGRGGALSMLSLGIKGVGTSAKIARASLVAPFAPFLTHILGVTQTASLRFRLMFREIRRGGIGVGGAMTGTAATLTRALLSLINPVNLVKASFVALKVALISTGIGAIVVGLAAAGAWVYSNWSGIKAMFTGIGYGIRLAFKPAGPLIDKVSSAFSRLSEWFSNITGKVDMTEEQWLALGISIGESIGSAVNSVMKKVNDLVEWFRGIPQRIMDAIGSINLGNLIEWPEPPQWWKSLFGEDEPQAIQVQAPAAMDYEGFDRLSGDQRNAARILEQDAAAGNIPTPAALAELEGYAASLRQEIAGIQAEMDNLIESPMKPALVAPMQGEMRQLQEELTAVEAELEVGTVRADELTWALGVLSETEATPEISTDSIDAALEKVRRLSAELGGLRNSVGNVSGPADIDGARASGGDVRAGGTYLVGEEGPELVTFGQRGFVHNARATMRAMRGATARLASGFGGEAASGLPGLGSLIEQGAEALQATSIRATGGASGQTSGGMTLAINSPLTGPITISSGQNPLDMVEQIGEALEMELARRMRGLYADGV